MRHVGCLDKMENNKRQITSQYGNQKIVDTYICSILLFVSGPLLDANIQK